MKKFLGLIAAAAMVAAGVAPAMAADVELSGEIKVKHEIKENADLSNATGDGRNYTKQRTRLNAKAKVDDQTTAFISLADVRYWGEDNTVIDTLTVPATHTTKNNPDGTGVHLNEGWLKVDNLLGPVGIKVGRQRLSFGKQRLLGALEWTLEGNRWDALNFQHRSDMVDVDLFFAQLSDTSHTSTDGDDQLNGLYVTLKPVKGQKIDVYAINKQTNTTYDSDLLTPLVYEGANQDFMTYGLRSAGKAGLLDWDAEYATQDGWSNDSGAVQSKQDASAWAIGLGASPTKMIRIGAQAWKADGDKGNTVNNEAFNGLYPTNHFKYGIADYAGSNWSNRQGYGFDVTAKPVKGLKIKAEYVILEAEEDFATGGNDVGHEYNLQVFVSLTEKVKLYVYGAWFNADYDYRSSLVAPLLNDERYEYYGVTIDAKF
ncbi:MAG: alginate export family protein [Proteobacteria bacterium]|nr:alginate export family protein [Pseudomonadota bacterium]